MVNSYGSISPTPPLMGLPSEKKSRGCSIGPVPAAVAVVAALLAGAAISWYFTAYGIGGSTKDTDLTADTGPTAAELRLPTSVIPESYDLTMKTYLPGYVAIPEGKNLTFEGQVKIKLSILQSVKKIVLNAKHLKFQESKCDLTVNGKSVKISEIMELPQFEKVAFHLEDALEPEQEVVLKVQYTGLISSDLGGLYQTVYTDKDGNQKIAAATQMEPTDARLMVPCMDEPAFKATWAVTVIHPTGTTAVSNGIELETTTVDDDFLSTQFKTTPKMSSYLLAVIISEFQFIEKTTASGVRFRVWSRPEAKEHTMYALESGVKCLEYYEKFYNISFPMEKQDMFALPDFSAGAMENWGLITYRESAVLYDPKIYSSLQKRRVAIVIAHELAHQWFGNLVTMQWWEDLWLNEGFATYVEHIGADEISDGRFRMEDVFMSNDLSRALDADNKASSHPLSFKIDKASEVREAFDTISYQKGGSVLRMIRSLMGEDNFNKGVNNYLTIHKYANARAIDLWMALDGASPDTVTGPDGERLNITQFALQWTTQLGFPYLTLNRLNSTSVEITQKRYKVNEEAKEKPKYANPEYKFKWDVPVWYQAGKAVPKLVWMKRDEPLQIVSDEAPIVLNAGSKAFMRQNYDKTEWKKIFAQMNTDHTVYDVATRHAIVSDAFMMANVEKLDYELLFDLLSYMKKETNYFVTEALQKGLFLIRSYFGTEPESKIVQEYMKKNTPHRGANETITSISENNLDEEKMYENLLEVENFDRICQLGSVDCNSQMKQLFKTEVVDKCKSGNMTSECVSITPPLRQLAYCYGVRNGDEGTFEKIMGFYKREKSQIERNNLLEALTCSRDPTTLKSLLLISMDRDSNVIRFQDVRGLFYNVAKNDVGKEFIFNFFLSRWEHIYESFQSDYKTISTIVTAATKSIRTQSQIDQLKNFRASAEHAGDYNAVSQSIEEAGHRVQWIEKNMQTLTKLFKQRLADES